jgi:hypothetical protein
LSAKTHSEADASRQKGVEGTSGLPPESVSRAARDYLARLDDASFGAATPVAPKFVSPSDPAARWTGADGEFAYFAFRQLLATARDRPKQQDHRRGARHAVVDDTSKEGIIDQLVNKVS